MPSATLLVLACLLPWSAAHLDVTQQIQVSDSELKDLIFLTEAVYSGYQDGFHIDVQFWKVGDDCWVAGIDGFIGAPERVLMSALQTRTPETIKTRYVRRVGQFGWVLTHETVLLRDAQVRGCSASNAPLDITEFITPEQFPVKGKFIPNHDKEPYSLVMWWSESGPEEDRSNRWKHSLDRGYGQGGNVWKELILTPHPAPASAFTPWSVLDESLLLDSDRSCALTIRFHLDFYKGSASFAPADDWSAVCHQLFATLMKTDSQGKSPLHSAVNKMNRGEPRESNHRQREREPIFPLEDVAELFSIGSVAPVIQCEMSSHPDYRGTGVVSGLSYCTNEDGRLVKCPDTERSECEEWVYWFDLSYNPR